MVERGQIVKGILAHFLLLIINFFVLLGVIESLQIFSDDIPIINAIILSYMLLHTISLLTIQLSIQILQLIRIRMPSFLIFYYFRFDDDETIPISLLDPTKSSLAVVILLLVISGGPFLYPIFAVYGFFLAYAYLTSIVIDPSTILYYFEVFLNYMPPVLMIIVAIVIISIVAIEFRHV